MKTIRNLAKIDFIGRTEAAFGISVAIVLDLLILLWNNFSFGEKEWNLLLLDALAFFLVAQISGTFAARAILVHDWSSGFVGICAAWITLLATTIAHCFLYGSVFEKSIVSETGNICVLVFLFGFIPSGIHGIWFGYRIYKRGQKLEP
ncbi:hypothetical protein [Flavobacterium sp.]|uniref:hypothetical protein n=1 Tax=Flavobacterium sp. TaxID=239 RepID=UPI00122BF7F8|nr:hypothetical protein [Flavobacterium sp.]RZJ70059.1 MAG: hypothetical protein EOO49_15515 [Flavobacterium sp.]